jgi:hypothetical protein
MPTDPEPQQPDRDRDDRALMGRAAEWLRDNPGQATGIGIATATDARALAVVLDILAVEVPYLDADPAIRPSSAAEACSAKQLPAPTAEPVAPAVDRQAATEHGLFTSLHSTVLDLFEATLAVSGTAG